MTRLRRSILATGLANALAAVALAAATPHATAAGTLEPLRTFIDEHCAKCHDDIEQEGGLDLTALDDDLSDPSLFEQWIRVHDRVARGEMPPPPKRRPPVAAQDAFLHRLAETLVAADEARRTDGRAIQRRLNRYEYENTLRDLLSLPNLSVRDALPEDGEAHRFNKAGSALDVSHVQLSRYLQAAEFALRQAIAPSVTPPATTTRRYYARDQSAFHRPIRFHPRIRRPFPLLGTEAQPDVVNGRAPWTVGDADPAQRELEAVGMVTSTYEPSEIAFNEFRAPLAARYRLRLLAYPVWVHHPIDPTGKIPHHRVDFARISPGRRSEPVVLYASIGKNLRRIGAFDATTDFRVAELEVWLEAGETIRPDAVRLFRARAPDFRNPLQEPDGMPGVAFRWLEVEGPRLETWPTAGHQLLFDTLPISDPPAGASPRLVDVHSADPAADAARLLIRFMQRVYRRPLQPGEESRFLTVIQRALAAGDSFRDALLGGYIAVLSSPGFLYTDESPGLLDDHALASRLSYFLWNSPPDDELRALADKSILHRADILRAQTERLLDHAKAQRFVDAFLDYWLDLRKIAATTPDATLFPDYQLDDFLVESMLEETRAFFATMLRENLGARNVVASDFALVNERLVQHYGLPSFEGVALRRVPLDANQPRGGLLTQATVLKVTANGTTTSPVIRGAWIMERILGRGPPPPPPAGVPALEPDTQGAVTLREQLERHAADAACAACHRTFDPVGFALEHFDPMGGWRERYRSTGPGTPVDGVGHNGQRFTFSLGARVDASGRLPDGRTFADVRDLKRILTADPAPIARSLLENLIVFATGAPVSFADRAAAEDILARARIDDYGVRTLIHEIVQSDLFQSK